MKFVLVLVLVLAAACGGGKKPAPTTTETHAEAKSEHAAMAPELTRFHDVLSPRWHAAKGEQRMKDTCGAIADFQANAAAIANAPAPAGQEATWPAATKQLSDAVTGLDTACKATDATAFEPAFEQVHTRFHALMEPGAHGEHEQHHD
ncbi:MAG: hypothetical protein ABI867_41710 [Kofleriaceae bacterium]